MLDDPALFKYPFAYMSEPGYWTLSEAETVGLRNYLLKGGFLIFDDFHDEHWFNLEAQMRKVLRDLRWVELDTTHPVYHSFFDIDSLEFDEPMYAPAIPDFLRVVRGQRPKRAAAIGGELQQRPR